MNRVRLYTANDAVARDPASILVEGSNAGFGGPFTVLFQGALALPDARNPGGTTDPYQDANNQPLDANPTTGSVYNFQDLTFANTVAYTTYRVTFRKKWCQALFVVFLPLQPCEASMAELPANRPAAAIRLPALSQAILYSSSRRVLTMPQAT